MRIPLVVVAAMTTLSTVASMPVPGESYQIPGPNDCEKLNGVLQPAGFGSCDQVRKSNKKKKIIFWTSAYATGLTFFGLTAWLGCKADGVCGKRHADGKHQSTASKKPVQNDGTLKDEEESLKASTELSSKPLDTDLNHIVDDAKGTSELHVPTGMKAVIHA